MQTAAYPEETEVSVAQESHPHAHLVTLLAWVCTGYGCCAGQGCGGHDLGRHSQSWACLSNKMTLSPNSPSGDFPLSILPSWKECLARPTPDPAKDRRCRGGGSSSLGREGLGAEQGRHVCCLTALQLCEECKPFPTGLATAKQF